MLSCSKSELSGVAGQKACTASITSLAHLHTGRQAACTGGVHVCAKKHLPCKKSLLLLGHCVKFMIPLTQMIPALLHPVMPACRVSIGRKPVWGEGPPDLLLLPDCRLEMRQKGLHFS